jgi:dienelactone hydrolase
MQSLQLFLGRVTVLTSVLWVVVLTAAGCGIRPASMHSGASGEAPAQTAYVPASGKGPAVIVLSGASGPRLYEAFSADLAKEGFYAVLLDGNDVPRNAPGEARLRSAIERAQSTPNVVSGKVAVVGFSLGGGAALVHAATMPELVSAVMVYYPSTAFVSDPREFTRRFHVPILMLAGERDQYNNCCLIEKARAIEAAAQEQRATFTLVAYPYAEHGFNLAVPAYRAQADADAWKRTLDMIRRYMHP